MSQVIVFGSSGGGGGGGTIKTLQGNNGPAVPPNGSGNIFVVGANPLTSTGNVGTNSITFSVLNASTTQVGVVTLATNAQTITGTDSTDAVVPSSLSAKLGTQTAHSLLVAEGTNAAFTALGVASNGQLPIGSAGADPVLATLTAGTNVAINNGAGSITISANNGSQIVNYTGVNHAASPYTVIPTDYYLGCDVTGGVITIRLPNEPTMGRIFAVKDIVGLAATSNITITTVGGAIDIDGNTSFVMNTAYEAANLIYDGVGYEIY